MAMLTLSNAILSMRTRTGELSESALLSNNTTQQLGDILTSRVITKHTNGCRILSADHGRKTLIYGEHLAARAHKIQPSVPGKIIYE
jgi:hypothetical protein